jgi:hypothetical protein
MIDYAQYQALTIAAHTREEDRGALRGELESAGFVSSGLAKHHPLHVARVQAHVDGVQMEQI